MRLTPNKLTTVVGDYPDILFLEGDEFHWSPHARRITYRLDDEHGFEHLLHELSHALLGHVQYAKDITLLQMERDAWHYATQTLAPLYSITIDDNLIQDDLDTYRDWLHARSNCPECSTTGVQLKNGLYRCIMCNVSWRANQAITNHLRRYKNTPSP